ALFSVVTFALPVMLALIGAVSIAGSLRLRDIVSTQGGWPWEWIAFRSPPSFLLFLFFIAAAAAPSSPSPSPTRTRALAEHAHLFVLCGVCVAVFLGGWKLPMMAPGAERTHALLSLGASLVFLAKVHVLAQLVTRGRRAISGVEIPALVGLYWQRIIPLGALALGACLAWSHLGLHPEMESLVAILDVVFLALLVARFTLRIRKSEPELRLNPFL
ncbi:MAG TPA: NADH-quinone oxidoreductase subunit H, partial [Polyangiaceae bacterium]|nr:NADH-quinone oxidoreductase subunit H [Polyangiaceae bacterium]